AFCDQLIACAATQQTHEECTSTFGAMRVSSACVEASAAATCEDLQSTESETLDVCFPRCDAAGTASCDAHGAVTQCSTAGRTLTLDCEAACVAGGFNAWTGVCGTTFEAQTSPTPRCWCD